MPVAITSNWNTVDPPVNVALNTASKAQNSPAGAVPEPARIGRPLIIFCPQTRARPLPAPVRSVGSPATDQPIMPSVP